MRSEVERGVVGQGTARPGTVWHGKARNYEHSNEGNQMTDDKAHTHSSECQHDEDDTSCVIALTANCCEYETTPAFFKDLKSMHARSKDYVLDQWLNTPADQLMEPFVVGWNADAKQALMCRMPWRDSDEKMAYFVAITNLFEEHKVSAYSFMSETWVSSYDTKTNKFIDDRLDAVSIVSVDKERNCFMTSFVRDAAAPKGVRLYEDGTLDLKSKTSKGMSAEGSTTTFLLGKNSPLHKESRNETLAQFEIRDPWKRKN